MKLDRNYPPNEGVGKYALIKVRRLTEIRQGGLSPAPVAEINKAIQLLQDAGIIDWGISGTESEFFVIRLKDWAADAGLLSYAKMASRFDREYSDEVKEMARRAGPSHPNCKIPD